jgi:thiamine biosynthesis lipoprotein
MKSPIHLLLVLALALLNQSCQSDRVMDPLNRNISVFAKRFTISVFDTVSNHKQIDQALTDFEAALNKYALVADLNLPNSEISRINLATENPIPISADFKSLLDTYAHWSDKTEGKVDPAMGLLKNRYNFGPDFVEPTPDELNSLLQQSGSEQLTYNDAMLERNKALLDFSDVIRGIAITRAKSILHKNGIFNFLINGHGKIEFSWQYTDTPADIFIRHPRKNGKLYGRFSVNTSCGIATVSDYYDFAVIDSKRFHAVLDKDTGLPANHMIAITVVAGSAEEADFMANYLFRIPVLEAKKFVTRNPHIDAVILTHGEGADGINHWVSSNRDLDFILID